MDTDYPNDILLRFLDDVPEKVKEHLYHEILHFLWTDKKYSDLIGADAKEFTKHFLTPASDSDKLRATVLVSAILDFTLSEQLLHSLEKIEEKAAETGSTRLLKMALAESIKQKQLRQAIESWFVLRQSQLSAKKLHQFQTSLIARSPNKP